MATIQITSFGYGHSPAPTADVTIDARRHLRNPHHDPAMRQLTGLDEAVRQHVLATPGAASIIQHTAAAAQDLAYAVPDGQITLALGCSGGRHRSVALACEIADVLRTHGLQVDLIHRDITKPVIQK